MISLNETSSWTTFHERDSYFHFYPIVIDNQARAKHFQEHDDEACFTFWRIPQWTRIYKFFQRNVSRLWNLFTVHFVFDAPLFFGNLNSGKTSENLWRTDCMKTLRIQFYALFWKQSMVIQTNFIN